MSEFPSSGAAPPQLPQAVLCAADGTRVEVSRHSSKLAGCLRDLLHGRTHTLVLPVLSTSGVLMYLLLVPSRILNVRAFFFFFHVHCCVRDHCSSFVLVVRCCLHSHGRCVRPHTQLFCFVLQFSLARTQNTQKRTILRNFATKLGKFMAAELLSGVLPTSWLARALLLLSFVSVQMFTFYTQHSTASGTASSSSSPSSCSNINDGRSRRRRSTVFFLQQAAHLLAPPPLRTVAALAHALRGALHPSLRDQLREMHSALLDVLGGEARAEGSSRSFVASSLTVALLLGSAVLAWRSAGVDQRELLPSLGETATGVRGMDRLLAKL
jgi:hypothetical protein